MESWSKVKIVSNIHIIHKNQIYGLKLYAKDSSTTKILFHLNDQPDITVEQSFITEWIWYFCVELCLINMQ